jgi:predicted peroxiredoxin
LNRETVKAVEQRFMEGDCLHFLLILSNPRVLRHVEGVAEAATGRRHRVTVFFSEESVKLLLDHERLRGLKAEMLACVTACEVTGVKQEDVVEGARVTSLAEVVTLMERCDRTLFVG